MRTETQESTAQLNSLQHDVAATSPLIDTLLCVLQGASVIIP